MPSKESKLPPAPELTIEEVRELRRDARNDRLFARAKSNEAIEEARRLVAEADAVLKKR